MCTASTMRSLRSLRGNPKVEEASSATRGVKPKRRATPRRLHGDVGEFLAGRHFVHAGVGHEDDAALGEDHDHADRRAGPCGASSTMRTSLSARRIVARDARHHRVGIARRQHRGRIDVAVVRHHAHAIAIERAAALHALVERVDIGRGFLRRMRHADFEAPFLDASVRECRS